MLLAASRRAQALQEASRDLDMEKLAIWGKLISKATGGAMMKTPKTLSSAQRTAMIAEPVMPAASAARRSARLAAQKGSRTAPVPSRAAGGATRKSGPLESTVSGRQRATAGPTMSREEMLAGTAVGKAPAAPAGARIGGSPAAELGIDAAQAAPRALGPLRQAALATGIGTAGVGTGALFGDPELNLHRAADPEPNFRKAAALSLGPEKLAALARALEQEKEASILRAIGGAIGTGLKGLKAGGTAGAKATTTAKAIGPMRHQLQTGLKAAKTGWRRGMDPAAAKVRTLGGKAGGAISPEAMAGATKAVAAAAAKAAPAAAAPAARGGLGLKGSTAVLGAGLLGGGAAVLGTQGALEGRSAQYVDGPRG